MLETEQQVFSLPEFCIRNKISKSKLFKLFRENRGPRFMLYGHHKRISIEAEREWRAAMEAYSVSKAGRLELERRKQHSTQAGKIAAKSEHHISARRRAAKLERAEA